MLKKLQICSLIKLNELLQSLNEYNIINLSFGTFELKR